MSADLCKMSFEHFSFSHISHQNEKHLHFTCPLVKWCGFSLFSTAFQKVKNIKIFLNRSLVKKCHIWVFHIFYNFSSKWGNIYISNVLWSTGSDLHHFKKVFRKPKTFKFFMTAALQKFGHFSISHIPHPNEQRFPFQVSCGQLVVVFIILKGFPDSQKDEDFHDRGPAKNCHFWAFHMFAYFSPKWELLTFQVSCGQLVVVFIIIKGFPGSRKKIFSWPRTSEKLSFLGISHFCIFLIQMSKYLHLKCPVVNWWWFLSFLKALQKIEKKWRFSWPRPCKKLSFLGISHFSYWNEQILTFHVSCGQLVVVIITLKGFPESRKNKVFNDLGPAKTCRFWALHIFAYISPKWANRYISSIQLSSGGG